MFKNTDGSNWMSRGCLLLAGQIFIACVIVYIVLKIAGLV